MKKRNVLIVLALLSAPFSASIASDSRNVVDVISPELVAQHSAAVWKKRADRARTDFFVEYNRLNEDPRFRVVCKPKAILGSQIKRRHCEPLYFKQRMYEETQIQSLPNGTMPTFSYFPNHENLLWYTMGMEVGADENLTYLLDNHPQLREKYKKFVRTSEAYNYKISSD